MGFLLGLKGFTAAVIGGIGSIPGAMLGGLLIGLAEALATGYLPQGSTFQDLWVFLLLILVLLVRPTGLLGRADITKV
jgi:branched-subunit amino acid ABC-type transport system permease component